MIVIFQILADDIAELLDACQYEVVEAFGLYRLYERLHETVQFRGTRWQPFYPAAGPLDVLVEASLEKRIVVVYEVFHALQPAVNRVGLVPGNLRHPVAVRVGSDAAAPDLPRRDVLEQEDMRPLEAVGREQLVCQEVRRSQHVLVRVEESLPVVRPVPVCREDAVLRHDAADGPDADSMAEVREIVGDAVVSPVRVLAGDSQDEVDHLLRRPRASDALAAAAGTVVLVGDEAAVPVHQGVGHPGVLDHLQQMGIEDARLGGKPPPVLVVQHDFLPAGRLLELLGHDVELLKEVVDRALHVRDVLAGRVFAETPHEGGDFAVEFFLLHMCKVLACIVGGVARQRNVYAGTIISRYGCV